MHLDVFMLMSAGVSVFPQVIVDDEVTHRFSTEGIYINNDVMLLESGRSSSHTHGDTREVVSYVVC